MKLPVEGHQSRHSIKQRLGQIRAQQLHAAAGIGHESFDEDIGGGKLRIEDWR
jgi:hypothetical protein